MPQPPAAHKKSKSIFAIQNVNKPQNFKLMNFYSNDVDEPDAIQPGEEAHEDGLNEHLNWGIPR